MESAGKTSIDNNGLTLDIRGGIGKQKRDNFCYLFRGARPLKRDLCKQRLALLLRYRAEHLCVYSTRNNRIDADLMGRCLPGKRFGKRDDACLGGGIVALTGITHNAGGGGYVHNASITLAHHHPDGGSAAEIEAGQIGVHDHLPILHRHHAKVSITHKAGIVDKHVEAAMALANAGEHLGNVGLIANRRADRNPVAAFFADSSEHTFGFGFSAEVIDVDESPVASQCAAGCRSDATAAARYQSSFLGEHPHSHSNADNSRIGNSVLDNSTAASSNALSTGTLS